MLRETERAGIEQIYLTMRSGLIRYASQRLSDPTDAEGVVQDAFLNLLRRQTLCDQGVGAAYVFAVVRNLIADRRRRRQRSNARDKQWASERSTIDGGPSAAHIILRSRISCLPPRCREALILVKFDGYTHAEAAALLKCAPRTIESQVRRAVSLLRRELAPCSGTETGAAELPSNVPEI
jgi:RNA polymerase sigma factor (sigma-70 family)